MDTKRTRLRKLDALGPKLPDEQLRLVSGGQNCTLKCVYVYHAEVDMDLDILELDDVSTPIRFKT